MKEDAKSGYQVTTDICARTHTFTYTKACDNFSTFTMGLNHDTLYEQPIVISFS